MRPQLLIWLLLAIPHSTACFAQAVDWDAVDRSRGIDTSPWPATAPATDAEVAAMRRAIAARKDTWCQPSDGHWEQALTFRAMPRAPGHRDFFAEPAQDCNRGIQGGNASQWFVELRGGRAHVLGKFGGWLKSVEPAESHGMHDVVMGWHNSAASYT